MLSAHRGVPGGEEDGEGGREIDVLIPQRDQDTAARATNLPVQDRVQDGVVTLNVLKEHGDKHLQITNARTRTHTKVPTNHQEKLGECMSS